MVLFSRSTSTPRTPGASQLDYYFIGENDGCIETSGKYDTADTGTLAASPYTGQKFSSIAGAKHFVPLECVYSTAIVPLPLPNVVFAGHGTLSL